METRTRAVVIAGTALLFFALLISGCTGGDPSAPVPESETPSESVAPPASGLRLAPGLYELEDGTAQAVGTLEWSELEGGFWLITGGTESEGNVGETVAVIANGSEFERELKPLEGKQIFVTGKKLDGASIRMAGPEIEIDSVEEISDTPGIAE